MSDVLPINACISNIALPTRRRKKTAEERRISAIKSAQKWNSKNKDKTKIYYQRYYNKKYGSEPKRRGRPRNNTTINSSNSSVDNIQETEIET